MFNQPAANNRTNRGGDCGEAGPCANGAAAVFIAEGRADDSETSWNEQSGTDALNGASHNQLANVRGSSTPCRGKGKKHHSHNKDATTAVSISERATHEQKCGECE